MSRPDPPVPQEAVDALQRGDLAAAFKSLRQAGGISMQAVGRALEAQARQQARAQPANRGDGMPEQRGAAAAETVEALADKARAARQGIAQQVALHRRRPPTVEMGDTPGSVRWMLIVLALLAAAIWILIGS